MQIMVTVLTDPAPFPDISIFPGGQEVDGGTGVGLGVGLSLGTAVGVEVGEDVGVGAAVGVADGDGLEKTRAVEKVLFVNLALVVN